ncbi:MAG TPA: Clp protease N-terminal domain-containing protein, partial [Polyangiales bacterium]|nr:Clp protease N-terminal domain-containing protein [Polyangiales bacterium]
MVAGFLGVQGFDSTVARAKEIAKRRGGQRLTTAHILCALWQGDERAMHVCMQLGLSEPRLLAALGPAHEERHNAIDLALERARTLSMELGRGPDALCLLAAITRDARSAASLALGHAGVVADDI